MQGGFSFCGVDIASFGLEYVPELSRVLEPFEQSSFSVSDESNETRYGGFFYGTTIKPKDFTLRCIFEDAYINDGNITKIENFFRRGRTGRLVFQHRDWIWYSATVISPIDLSKLTNNRNGFVTIQLRAYYPFGRSDIFAVPHNADTLEKNRMYGNSNMLDEITSGNTYISPNPVMNLITTSGTVNINSTGNSYLMYNPGTENAHCAIEIAGAVNDGLYIENLSTNQRCGFKALSLAVTTNAGKYLVVDGINGKTILVPENGSAPGEPAFLYHDGGFIELVPGDIKRDIPFTIENNNSSSLLDINGQLDDNDVGRYIYLQNSYHKIRTITPETTGNRVVIEGNLDAGTETGCAMTMNEIRASAVSTATLKRLRFVYKPTYR